jgi:hypothetical protein
VVIPKIGPCIRQQDQKQHKYFEWACAENEHDTNDSHKQNVRYHRVNSLRAISKLNHTVTPAKAEVQCPLKKCKTYSYSINYCACSPVCEQQKLSMGLWMPGYGAPFSFPELWKYGTNVESLDR